MIARRDMLAALALSAGAGAVSAHAAGSADALVHVAIFRFPDAHLDQAMAAFRGIAAATRGKDGNLAYDVYRGSADRNAFTLVERWASQAALEAHERSEAFIRLGQGVLTRYATLHDTLTGEPFA